jgi:putative PIN family toxin of toxin-antitoxin system
MEERKLRVFLDSNIILSGLISSQGAPRLILDLLSLRLPILQGVTGRYNLAEVERNIARRLPKALPVFSEYLPKLDLEIVPVPFVEELEPFQGAVDDNDLPVLASAAMGRADLFVTGDKKLLAQIERQQAFSIRSISAADFLDRVLPDILTGEKPLKGKDR